MTRAGVIVTHTPSSMPRPVATIALSFVLALAGRLFLKDRLTRTGRWHERMDNMGMGLTGRTLGVVGAGRIGKELLRMARTFDLKLLAADPYVNAIELRYLGARKVDLDTLLRRIGLRRRLLPAQRRHAPLVGAPQFARMRPTRVLHQRRARADRRRSRADRRAPAGRIAGAALDVFEQEPVAPDNPLLAMDNVIVTPHSLCWTDECFHNMAATGLASIVDALAGRRPEFVVNPEVLAHAAGGGAPQRVIRTCPAAEARPARANRVALLRFADDVGALRRDEPELARVQRRLRSNAPNGAS